MKIIIFGGTGHIGRFLIPMLAAAGHEPIVVVRGQTPIPRTPAWSGIRVVAYGTDADGTLRQLAAESPQAVIELPGALLRAYEMFKGTAQHIIGLGSLWMYGEPRIVPTPEQTQNPCLFPGYAQRYADIQQLLGRSVKDGVPFSMVMTSNICGPGKIPLECLGGRDIAVHRAHAAGQEVILPEGADSLVAPCDAEDVARCLFLAVERRDQSAGRMFNVGPASALTWTQFVALYSDLYRVPIPIRRMGWNEYVETISPSMGHWWHMKAHMCPDISAARRLLGYEPAYGPRETLERAVAWMRQEKLL